MYRFMQIQHSSDIWKTVGELHGGAALSKRLLDTCQSYLEIYTYLILEIGSLRNEPILVRNELFYVFQLALPYSYFIQKKILFFLFFKFHLLENTYKCILMQKSISIIHYYKLL